MSYYLSLKVTLVCRESCYTIATNKERRKEMVRFKRQKIEKSCERQQSSNPPGNDDSVESNPGLYKNA